MGRVAMNMDLHVMELLVISNNYHFIKLYLQNAC